MKCTRCLKKELQPHQNQGIMMCEECVKKSNKNNTGVSECIVRFNRG